MNDHGVAVIDEFKGLWRRDGSPIDSNSCPPDHSTELLNVDFTRYGIKNRERFGIYAITVLLDPVRRMFPFTFGSIEGFLIVAGGDLYSLLSDNTLTLLITGSTNYDDYDFLLWNNRIYIVRSIDGGYSGASGTGYYYVQSPATAVVACGLINPAGNAVLANSGTAGIVQAGTRFAGISYESATGFLSPPVVTNPVSVVCPGTEQLAFTAIPVGPAGTVARWIVVTKAISSPIPGGTLSSYRYYFLYRIPDNVATTATLNFYDSQLLSEATYLSDILNPISGGVSICQYKNRVVIAGSYAGGVNSILISRINEPETFDLVDGLLIIDPSKTITLPTTFGYSTATQVGFVDCENFRDNLYATKLNATYCLTDVGDEPAFWVINIIDQGLGSYKNGIATVMDQGGSNIDYLIIANRSGLYLFTGSFLRPELSWKIAYDWENVITPELLYRNARISVANDIVRKKVYITVANDAMTTYFYFFDYTDIDSEIGSYSKAIKWARWSMNVSAPIPLLAVAIRDVGNESIVYVVTQYTDITDTYAIIYQYANLTQQENIPMVRLSTYALRDKDDKMLHVGALRLKISSTSVASTTVTPTIYDANNSVRSIVMPTISVPDNSQIEPTLVTNFIAQRMYVQLDLSGNPIFLLEKAVIYVDPIYTSIPYQYVP